MKWLLKLSIFSFSDFITLMLPYFHQRMGFVHPFFFSLPIRNPKMRLYEQQLFTGGCLWRCTAVELSQRVFFTLCYCLYLSPATEPVITLAPSMRRWIVSVLVSYVLPCYKKSNLPIQLTWATVVRAAIWFSKLHEHS